jgi:hypothetical protein
MVEGSIAVATTQDKIDWFAGARETEPPKQANRQFRENRR